MLPTLLTIAGFSLATYGALVAAGFLAGMLYLGRHRADTGFDEESLNSLMTGLVVTGFLGAKLLYLGLYWDTYATFGEMFSSLRYGFVFYGGFLGAAAYGAWYCRRKGVAFWRASDPFAPALALGHGLGRLGCFAAGCCFGAPTDLPWGLAFRSVEAAVPPSLLGVPLHPAQLYEAAADFAIAGFLHAGLLPRVRDGRLPRGTVFAAYLGLYGVARFLVELTRGDDRGFYGFGLSVSQWLGLSLAAVSVVLVARRAHAR